MISLPLKMHFLKANFPKQVWESELSLCTCFSTFTNFVVQITAQKGAYENTKGKYNRWKLSLSESKQAFKNTKCKDVHPGRELRTNPGTNFHMDFCKDIHEEKRQKQGGKLKKKKLGKIK